MNKTTLQCNLILKIASEGKLAIYKETFFMMQKILLGGVKTLSI